VKNAKVAVDRCTARQAASTLPAAKIARRIEIVLCVCVVIYRVSQEECARLREGVPFVKVYRYNSKHLYPKLNGYGDNDHYKSGRFLRFQILQPAQLIRHVTMLAP